jgi:hypothetical protein
VLGGQVADAAAEREPADAGGADDASRRDEAERLRRRVEVEPRRAAVGAGEPRIRVHLDRPHLRKVDHEPAVADAMPRRVVPASAHGHLELVRPGEVERGDYVGAAQALRDDRRPPVDERVVRAPRRVVLGIGRSENRAGERPPEVVDVHDWLSGWDD